MTDSSDPFGSPSAPGKSGDFDFSIDVKDKVLLPAGVYKVRCSGVEMSTSQNGNPTLAWDFIVVGKNELVKSWTALTSDAKWKLIEFLKSFGVTLPEAGEIKFNRDQVIGKIIAAEITHRKWQGVDRLNINKVYSLEEYGEENILPQGEGDPDIPL